jgi:hypothetical protein
MLEAMYDTDEAKLEKGLMDYDYCSNLGLDYLDFKIARMSQFFGRRCK